MISIYTLKLGLIIQKSYVGAKKIDGTVLKIYDMVTTQFLTQDSLKMVQFFKKTILLAKISMEVILRMPFLLLSNVNVKLAERPEKLT